MKKLRIWLIQHGEPLPVFSNAPSFRTARLSKELAFRGHEVTYWCSSLWHHTKQVYCHQNQVVKVDGYNLYVLHAGKYQSNHSLGRYLHHKKMARLFSKESRNMEKPDIILAGFPIHYCAYEAVKYGKQKQIPVVVDIRDYWPDNFLMLFPEKLKWMGRLLFKRDFQIAKAALQNATVLISMMSELLEWGVKKYAERDFHRDDRVFFIGGDDLNAGQCKNLTKAFPLLEGRTHGRFIVNYIGSFSYLNHPLVIVEAAKYLASIGHKDDILFILAGEGDYYERCVKAAKGLDNVVFVGWIDTNGITALNSVSSIGVIPSYQKVCFPNKAFSYLGGGLPILSSEQGDLKSLLEEYRAGFFFDIRDPLQLGQKILELSRLDREAFEKLSRNCKSLFHDHFQADKIYKQYADHLEHIALKYGRSEKI